MKTKHQISVSRRERRGSTLIIVIALLGLLAFTGMIFFSFSSQERAAAEFFSEAAKAEVDEPDNVWDHPMRQIISGPSNRPSEIRSILWSETRRHSLANNMFGRDLAPYSGEGLHLIYQDDPATPLDTTPVARVDMDWDGTANDEDGDAGEPDNQTLLDFVDSPAARGGSQVRPDAVPAPDVDYTYPDINNLFLAYKGWAIRDNGIGEDINENGQLDPGEDANTNNVLDPTPRYERVPVIIPSFFRPQYMKTAETGVGNGPGGSDVPTDLDWASSYDGVDPTSAKFPQRTFRPHPMHIVGFQADGTTPVFRYLTDAEAAGAGVSSGGFPFVPEDNLAGQPGGLNGVRGEMGIWTGSDPSAYELDADPDGDGIREGIWIDTHFPVQEYTDAGGTPKLYVVLHSFSIYDLDGLINLTTHGNLAGLDRSGNLQTITSSNLLAQQYLSKSNMGLGPNEINPLWALRTNLLAPVTPDVARQFTHHFGRVPTNNIEQANMEWVWLMGGRAQIGATNLLENIFAGRWGETDRVFNSYRPGGGTFLIADLPRPGRSGSAQDFLSAGTRFGGGFSGNGRNGFDDNVDSLEGEVNARMGRIRPFGTPMDYSGAGRAHNGAIGNYDSVTGRFTIPSGGDVRTRLLHHDTASTGPERFQLFDGYSVARDVDTTAQRYLFGQNGTFNNANSTSDDLVHNARLDALFEDPLESIFDADLSQRDFDRIFGPEDAFGLHLTAADLASNPEISNRLEELSPYALQTGFAPFSFNEQTTPGMRSRFTTISNSLRRFLMRSPFGADGKPGIAGFDDNNDGVADNIADLTDPATTFVSGVRTAAGIDNDNINRAWEFTADTDGNSTDNAGYPRGDGNLEFPPAYFANPNDPQKNVKGYPYTATDPFRPQVRRLLTLESGDSRSLVGQLPLSINHLLDVERNERTPDEGTPEFLRYMLRAGMRFRPLTDHPSAVEGTTVTDLTTIPVWSTATPVPFPPVDPDDREFWARRDRQKLARDIYTLLYTTGGAGIDSSFTPARVRDYTGTNDPSLENGEAGCLYTHEQLRRMAQFAVNMVDAMDSDNISTKFEYDKNLGSSGAFGGWNLDDDPYAPNAVDNSRGLNEDAPSTDPDVTEKGLYAEDGLERGVVWGVEAQELVLSETLAARFPMFAGTYADSPQTVHNDTADELNFLHVELQNLRPTLVEMTNPGTGTTNEEQAIWQLARFDRANRADPEPTAPTQTLSLMAGNPSVDGGGRFSIAIAAKDGDPGNLNPTGWATADIYVDHDSNNTFELVSPDVTAASVAAGSTVTAHCNLDVIESTHSSRWLATGNSSQPGRFLDTLNPYFGNDKFGIPDDLTGTPQPEGFDLVLRRRANPNMPRLSLANNPWIEVDRIRVYFRDMFVDTGMPNMVWQPDNAPSTERNEVLDATDLADYDDSIDPASNPWRFNTLGGVTRNSRTSASGFDLLQNHYDREFASSSELLQLPVIGPSLLTTRIDRMRYSPYQQVYDNYEVTLANPIAPFPTPRSSWICSAEAMFLQPDFPNLSPADADTVSPTVVLDPTTPTPPGGANAPVQAVNAALDNRWYRLLQFVEVPSRVHRMLGNYVALQKLPGKLNVNMIRHREVLAGLIDNTYLADVPPLADHTANHAAGSSSPPNGLEDGPFMVAEDTLARINPANEAIVIKRDVWREMLEDRDGRPVQGWDPDTSTQLGFLMPGTPNARPFRSSGFRNPTASDNGQDETLLRRNRRDLDDNNDGQIGNSGIGFNADGTAVASGTDLVGTNRHWLELASTKLHVSAASRSSEASVGEKTSAESRHRILSKVMNNSTTVSNTFIVYGVAAYFEAIEDPTTGLIRVGGRLDLDGDGDETNDEQRSVFIIDRTEALEAYDAGSGDFDWKRLVKARANIE